MVIALRDFSGASVSVPTPPDNGRAAAAASRPVALSNEDLAALNATATSAKQDAQTSILTLMAGYLDGVEGLLSGTATQTTLAALLAKVIAAPATEAKQDTLNTGMTSLLGYVDTLEALIASTNTLLTTQNGYLDTVETLLAAPTPAGTQTIGSVGVNSPTSIAAGQGTVTTTAASLVAARTGRKTLTIENTSAVAFYVGPTGVLATTGLLVPGVVGASVTVDSAAAFFAITATGSATASFLETF